MEKKSEEQKNSEYFFGKDKNETNHRRDINMTMTTDPRTNCLGCVMNNHKRLVLSGYALRNNLFFLVAGLIRTLLKD